MKTNICRFEKVNRPAVDTHPKKSEYKQSVSKLLLSATFIEKHGIDTKCLCTLFCHQTISELTYRTLLDTVVFLSNNIIMYKNFLFFFIQKPNIEFSE